MYTITYIKKNIEIIIFYILVIILILIILYRNWKSLIDEENGINRLDAIIYINLENSEEKKELLFKELLKLNTNMNKVHKVNGICISKNGYKNCIQSHILALKMIKDKKWNRVLILEDDVKLNMNSDRFNDLLNSSLDSLDTQQPNWNVIMLSTSNIIFNNKIEPININIMSNDIKEQLQIKKIINATSSSAYIVNNNKLDNILKLFNNNTEQLTLDEKWNELQIKDNWFALNKDPIKQRKI